MGRVEGITDGPEDDQAMFGGHLLELLGHHLESAVQFPMGLGQLDRVEHRHQIGHDDLYPHLPGQRPIAVHAFLVVDVLGLETLQIGGSLRCDGLPVARFLRRLVALHASPGLGRPGGLGGSRGG